MAIGARKDIAKRTSDNVRTRLAASIAQNMRDIKRGLKLDDEQAENFSESLTKILIDAMAPELEQEDSGLHAHGGEESPKEEKANNPDKGVVKSSDNNNHETLPEYNAEASYSSGDKFTRNGKTYQVGDDGKAHLVK